MARATPSASASRSTGRVTSATDIGNLIMNKASPGRRQAKMGRHPSSVAKDAEGHYDGFSDKLRPSNSAFGVRVGSKYLRGPSEAPSYLADDANPRKRRMLKSADEVSDDELLTKPVAKKRVVTELSHDSGELHHYSNDLAPPHTPRVKDETAATHYPSSVPAKRILQSIVNHNRRLAAPITSSDAAPALAPASAPAWATPARPSAPQSDELASTQKKRRRLDLDLPPATSLLESAATWTQRKKQRIGKVVHTSSLLTTPTPGSAGLFASPAAISASSSSSSSAASAEAGPALKKAKQSESESFVTKPSDEGAKASVGGWKPSAAKASSSSAPSAPSSSDPKKPAGMSDAEWNEVKPKAANAATLAFMGGASSKPSPSVSSSSDPKKPAGMSDAEWNEVKPKAANAATLAFMGGAATAAKPTATKSEETPKSEKKEADKSETSKSDAKPLFKPFTPSVKASAAASAPSAAKATGSDPQKPAGLTDAEWNEVKPKAPSAATLAFMGGAAKTTKSDAPNEDATAKAEAPTAAKPAFKPFTPSLKSTAATEAKPASSDPQKPAGMSDAEWNEVKPKAANAATMAFMSGGAKPSAPKADAPQEAKEGDKKEAEAKPEKASTSEAPAKPLFKPFTPIAKSTAAPTASASLSNPQKPAGMSDAEWNEVKPKAANAATMAFMGKSTPAVAASSDAPNKSESLSDSKKPAGMSDAEWNEVKPKAASAATMAFMAKSAPTTDASTTAPAKTGISDSDLKELKATSPASLAFGKSKPSVGASNGATAPTAAVPNADSSELAKPASKAKEKDESEAPKNTGFTFSSSPTSAPLSKFGSFGTKPLTSSSETKKEVSTEAAKSEEPKKLSFGNFKPVAVTTAAGSADVAATVAAAAKSSASMFGTKVTKEAKEASAAPTTNTAPKTSFGAPAFKFGGSTAKDSESEKPEAVTSVTKPATTATTFGAAEAKGASQTEKPASAFPKMTAFGKKDGEASTTSAASSSSATATPTASSFAKFGAGSTSSASGEKPVFGGLKSSTNALKPASPVATSEKPATTFGTPKFGSIAAASQPSASPRFGGSAQSTLGAATAKATAFDFSSGAKPAVADPLAAFKAAGSASKPALVADPLAAFKAAGSASTSGTTSPAPTTSWGSTANGTGFGATSNASTGSGTSSAATLFGSSNAKNLFGSTPASNTTPSTGFGATTASSFGVKPSGFASTAPGFPAAQPQSSFGASSAPATGFGANKPGFPASAPATATGFPAAAPATATGFPAAAPTSFGATQGGFGSGGGTAFGASSGSSFGKTTGGGGGMIPSGVGGFASSGFGKSGGAPSTSFGASSGGTGFGTSSGGGTSFGASSGTSFGASSGGTNFGTSSGAGTGFGASSGASTLFGAGTSSSPAPLFGASGSASSSFPATTSSGSNSPRHRTRPIRRPR
jgi:hypothetical protein